MRTYKMDNWKIEDYGAAVVGCISGCIAYIKGMPTFGFVQLNASSEVIHLMWSCFVAFCVAIAGWLGKKLVEECWPWIKQKLITRSKKDSNV